MKHWTGFFILLFSLSSPAATPEKTEQIPGMTYLINMVSSMPVAEEAKNRLLKAIQPAPDRNYYRLGDDFLDGARRDELIREYSELFHVPKEQVILFAVTSPAEKRTVLFPAFYQLKSEQEQAAALLHESIWIAGSPGATYPAVVRIEKSALDFFMNPKDPNAFFVFYQNLIGLFDPDILLDATLDFDQKAGTAPATLVDIFGRDFLKCYFLDRQLEFECKGLLQTYLATTPLAQSSLFLQAFGVALDQMSVLWMPTVLPNFPVKTPQDLDAFEKTISVSIQREPTRGPIFFMLLQNQKHVGLFELESLGQRRH